MSLEDKVKKLGKKLALGAALASMFASLGCGGIVKKENYPLYFSVVKHGGTIIDEENDVDQIIDGMSKLNSVIYSLQSNGWQPEDPEYVKSLNLTQIIADNFGSPTSLEIYTRGVGGDKDIIAKYGIMDENENFVPLFSFMADGTDISRYREAVKQIWNAVERMEQRYGNDVEITVYDSDYQKGF